VGLGISLDVLADEFSSRGDRERTRDSIYLDQDRRRTSMITVTMPATNPMIIIGVVIERFCGG
jgi:hypothetical protein